MQNSDHGKTAEPNDIEANVWDVGHDEWRSVVEAVIAVVGLPSLEAKRLLRSHVAKRIGGSIRLNAFKELFAGLAAGKRYSLGAQPSYFWDDRQGGATVRRVDCLDAKLEPIGRAKLGKLKILWYPANSSNCQAGANYTRFENLLASGDASLDPVYDKVMKRDPTKLRFWTYAHLTDGSFRFVSWSLEGLCSSFVRRAMYKNFFQISLAKTIVVKVVGEKRILEGPKKALPGRVSGTVRILPYDAVAREFTLGTITASDPSIYVSRAVNDAQLRHDVTAVWAGSIQDQLVLTRSTTIICPFLSKEDLNGIVNTWGLDMPRDNRFRKAWLAPYLIAKFGDTGICSVNVSSVDDLRLLDLEVDAKFKYRHGLGWHGPGWFEREQIGFAMPNSSWVMRLAHTYGLLELDDDVMVPVKTWGSRNNAVFTRGIFTCGLGDYVTQNVCGHWSNLTLLQHAGVIEAMWHMFVIMLGGLVVNSKGAFTWSGCYPVISAIQVEGVGFPGATGGSAGLTSLLYSVRTEESKEEPTGPRPTESDEGSGSEGGNDVEQADRPEDVGVNTDEGLLVDLIDEPAFVESKTTARYRRAEDASTRAWVIMTRGNWLAYWPNWLDSLWAGDYSSEVLPEVDVAGCFEAEALSSAGADSLVTRALLSGQKGAVVTYMTTRGMQRIPLLRSYGEGSFETALCWSKEFGGAAGLREVVLKGGVLSLHAIEKAFSVPKRANLIGLKIRNEMKHF